MSTNSGHWARISDSFNPDFVIRPEILKTNDSLAGLIHEIANGLRGVGGTVNPSSRLMEYARRFARDEDDDDRFLDYSFLEVLQFMVIRQALETMNDPSPWLRMVDSACGGQVHPTLDRADCKARSDQFELMLMAFLTLAGFQVRPAEPDLRGHIGDVEVAFAAKRVRTITKLHRNLSGACTQLARHGLPGYVCVDLSFANDFPKPVYLPTPQNMQYFAAMMLNAFVMANQAKLMAIAERPFVLGVLLHFSATVRTVNPLSRVVSRRFILLAERDSRPSQILSAAIQNLGSASHRIPNTVARPLP